MLPLKEQFAHINKRFEQRLTLLGPLMKECDVDCWVVLAKEYNEDPVMHYLTPADFITARRLTMLIIVREGNEVHLFNGGRPDPSLNEYYTQSYDEIKGSQWHCLQLVFEKYNPKNIALNYSQHFAFGDGLSKGIYDEFASEIDEKFVRCVISGETLAIRFLETRLQEEINDYQEIGRVAHQIISETFSDEVIEIGKTTADDLEWYMKQRTHDLGMPCWFLPTMDIQRPGKGMLSGDEVILRGDLLHCDYGLKYLNLCTDTQRLCYVLKEGETTLPEDLAEGMKQNNHFQDIVSACMQIGKTGNEVFIEALKQAHAEGIECLLYSHPIGFYGHGPGPTIGLYNQQEPIPIKGDVKLAENTCYALELMTKKELPNWQQKIWFMTEETVMLNKEGVHYLMPGRKEIYLVGRK